MHSSTSHLLPFPLPQFSIFDSEALKNIFIQENINLKHILTLQKYVAKAFNPYQLDFTQLKGIPNKCKEILNQHQFGLVSKVIQTQQSEDGSTTKLVIQLPSKKCIETVVMHYDRKHSFKSNLQHELELELGVNENPSNANKKSGSVLQPRSTACLSSQVGCKMACSFCATGTMGFMAQLSSVDILEQWVHANHVRKCTNLVFMGMGEPFDNYLALCTAIHQLHHVFQLGPKHICVSTVGVVPKMIQFTIDCPGVHLALSLHAPTQACREKLVPTAKNYPIDKLMLAVDQYLKLHDRIMIEYILIRDLNATSVCAHQLGHLLSERSVILNLIPYNPTLANDQYHAPTSEEILAFETILRETYNIRTTVRRTMGQDIDGACGQLVLKKTSCTSNPSTTPLSTSLVDIEDVGSTSCSSTSKTSSLALPLPSPRSKKYIRSTPPTLKSTPSPFTTTTSSTPSTSSWTRTLLGSKWLTWLLTVVVGWVLMDGLVYRWRWGWNEFSSST